MFLGVNDQCSSKRFVVPCKLEHQLVLGRSFLSLNLFSIRTNESKFGSHGGSSLHLDNHIDVMAERSVRILLCHPSNPRSVKIGTILQHNAHHLAEHISAFSYDSFVVTRLVAFQDQQVVSVTFLQSGGVCGKGAANCCRSGSSPPKFIISSIFQRISVSIPFGLCLPGSYYRPGWRD
jgi:hypothetical protein